MTPIIGNCYKLKNTRSTVYNGPAEYNNKYAKLSAILEDIDGGLFFESGLSGIRYWNIEDVEEVK